MQIDLFQEAEYTPQFSAYAEAHGMTCAEIIAHDKIEYPGGHVAGYIIWISRKHRNAQTATGIDQYRPQEQR